MAVVNKMWIGLAFASTLLPLLWILVWVCAFGNNCIRVGNITDSVLWNWHPFLMTLAFTFLVANGMLAWRGLPFSHTNRKIVHAFLNSCAVITSALGLWVVHGWKERIGDNHFYNAHNWLGMFSLVALWSQWLGGFFLGVMPMPASFKASAAPLHRFWGRFVYISGIATILTGILNHEMFLLARYGAFDQTVDFGNVFVLVGLLSSFLVLHNLEREYMPFPVDYPPVKGMASSHPAHLTEAAGVASMPTTARGTPEVISMRPSAAPGVY